MHLGLLNLGVFWIESRDGGAIFRVEIQGRNGIELAQCLAHGGKKYLPNRTVVFKLDFSFRRMYVYIYLRRVYLEIYKIRHLFIVGNQTLVGCHDGLGEIRMLHVAAIDEEILMETLLLRTLRRSDIPVYLRQRSLYTDRKKFAVDIFPKMPLILERKLPAGRFCSTLSPE